MIRSASRSVAFILIVAGFGGASACAGDDTVVAAASDGGTTPADASSSSEDGSITDASISDASQKLDADAATGAPTLPSQVVTLGCTKSAFFDDFTDLSTIDLDDTMADGFNWYVQSATSGAVTPKTSITHVNFGGVNAVRLDGAHGSGIDGVTRSAAHGAVGKSFAPQIDGCTYFEARIALALPDVDASDNRSWPAFWVMDTPHLQNIATTWQGNPNASYDHFIEVDIMEMNAGLNERSTIIDWYGQYGTATPTCSATSYCKDQVTQSLGPNTAGHYDSPESAPVFHRFGALWIPSSTKVAGGPYGQGSMQWFIDGAPAGTPIIWTGRPSTTTFVPANPWKYAIADEDSVGLMLDTGSDAYLDLDYVGVWQSH